MVNGRGNVGLYSNYKNSALVLAVLGLLFSGCNDNSVGAEKAIVVNEIHSSTLADRGNELDTAIPSLEPSLRIEQADIATMNQGWTENHRIDFYNTSQGSQLIPYSWFLALEQADNEHLFRSDKNFRKLGYIPQQKTLGINPDGLPIGFVKDSDSEAFLSTPFSLSASRLSSEISGDQREYKVWLGLTCAACHTSEILYGGQTIRIDGGPPMSDFQALIEGMSEALSATIKDDAKLTRFSRNVHAEGGHSEAEKKRLKSEVTSLLAWIDNYIQMNYGGLATDYGYGRLDAFGAILNRVTASFTGIEGNASPANAPVSYPYLWNASQLRWVQWNGSADNHIGRNVGEVSGVFAHTIVNTSDDEERFQSSARIINLDHLEQLMSQLDSPKWGPPLPTIDQQKATSGKVLFAENCAGCHGLRNEQGQFPMTDPNPLGKTFIKIRMIPLGMIGTDPLMAMNFIDPALNVEPGVVRSYLPEEYQELERVPRAVMLSTVVRKVIEKQISAFNPALDQQQLLELAGYHLPADQGGEAPPNMAAYKARPLNGAWATAPFLHNGSVSSLYQLLLPAAEREKSFRVGGREFDTEKVGLIDEPNGNGFLFRTSDDQGMPIPGNANSGHTGKRHTMTRDGGAEWRDFTHVERMQLIEYIKTL